MTILVNSIFTRTSINPPLKRIASRTVFNSYRNHHTKPDNIMYARFICALGLVVAATPSIFYKNEASAVSAFGNRRYALHSHRDHQYFH